jgi:hypothetical protein
MPIIPTFWLRSLTMDWFLSNKVDRCGDRIAIGYLVIYIQTKATQTKKCLCREDRLSILEPNGESLYSRLKIQVPQERASGNSELLFT